MKKQFALFLALVLLPVLVLSGCSIPNVSATENLGASSASQSANVSEATAVTNVQEVASVTQAQQATPSTPALNADTVVEALQSDLSQIYGQVNPSVVNIQVVEKATGGSSLMPQFPGTPDLPGNPSQPSQQALASGFVWDTQGHIVTNNHVVDGADKITVTFADSTTVQATVVGTDPNADLAVLKVDLPADQLRPMQVADSNQVKVGDLAVVIGNPYGLEGTMTVGFISALGRSLPVSSGSSTTGSYTIPDIIQTDAPINPGNSGGVLVDDQGRLIGVPTAIESETGQNGGIGFAVPSAIVQKVVPQLISKGSVEYSWLGITGTTLTPEMAKAMSLDENQHGALVTQVTSDSPAEKAGLRGSDEQVQVDGQSLDVGGDVIVAIGGQAVKTFDDLVAYLVGSTNVGDTVSLTILRDGKELTLDVTLAARPKANQAPARSQESGAAGAWLGIEGMTLSPEIAQAMDLGRDQTGVLIVQVVADSPASAAGLRGSDKTETINDQQVQVGGDVIVAADGRSIAGIQDLQDFLSQAKPGQEVTLKVLREGKTVTVDVTLGERPLSNQ